jgi:hypothetical protein
MIEAINALLDDVNGDVTEADAILEEALMHGPFS